ncbi:hypothetical protein Patl1_30242 [Pistacia atlantica]|uniref:Uncharacterized protein n=1 Tax=Pistacia atlantica TaxID=434234 RepID=A0ACC1ADK4_9ROSI|nr:hypothetical protein Patl1_30242 [Pistacia atlantica]
MIQVDNRKPAGRIKTCRMHYLLRGEWESKAKEANFVNSPSEVVSSTLSSSSSSATIHKLADHLDSRMKVSFTFIVINPQIIPCDLVILIFVLFCPLIPVKDSGLEMILGNFFNGELLEGYS